MPIDFDDDSMQSSTQVGREEHAGRPSALACVGRGLEEAKISPNRSM